MFDRGNVRSLFEQLEAAIREEMSADGEELRLLSIEVVGLRSGWGQLSGCTCRACISHLLSGISQTISTGVPAASVSVVERPDVERQVH